MGKWKLDYSACEGYDEFMSAEVNKMIVADMMMMMVMRMMMVMILMMMMMATASLQMQRLTMIIIRNVFYQKKLFHRSRLVFQPFSIICISKKYKLHFCFTQGIPPDDLAKMKAHDCIITFSKASHILVYHLNKHM